MYLACAKPVVKFPAIIIQISAPTSLFADMQFPIDIRIVRKDHEFLDGDAIESLFR